MQSFFPPPKNIVTKRKLPIVIHSLLTKETHYDIISSSLTFLLPIYGDLYTQIPNINIRGVRIVAI